MRRLCLAAVIIALLQAGAGCRKAENTASTSGKDSAGLDARLARLTESLARRKNRSPAQVRPSKSPRSSCFPTKNCLMTTPRR